jgi:CheY-like chemotaxis protein/two-component sensor histidine kinase
MSHEIRTPMTAVIGYADLLGDPNQSDESRQEWSRVIRRNAAHLLDLLNDILDVSRIEAGKLAVESISCDVVQLVNEVAEMMRPRAVEKSIALRVEVDGRIDAGIDTDPLRLRQVLMNLVGNAVKFTEAGEVEVRIGCNNDAHGQRQLDIQVRDTGIGMSPEQLKCIFKPFTQGDGTMTRRFGGSGLGLTISKRLVEMLGGAIDVRSEPRLGSTFRVTLPIARAASVVDESSALTAAPTSFASPAVVQGARILVAEDAPDMQRLIALLLTRAGAKVAVVNNGIEAVDAATSQPFDLILMDMQMEQMDGNHATAEIRRRGVRTPIIALTANAMAGDRDRCLSAGCDDYLTKPLERSVLLARVRDQLHRSRPLLNAKVA